MCLGGPVMQVGQAQALRTRASRKVQRSGQPVIDVYVERDSPALRRQIPNTVEGVNVRIVETGRFEAR